MLTKIEKFSERDEALEAEDGELRRSRLHRIVNFIVLWLPNVWRPLVRFEDNETQGAAQDEGSTDRELGLQDC
jgi:hypothetical protein